MKPASEVTHLADRPEELGRRLVDEGRSTRRTLARLVESHRQGNESLLGAVVEVALDAAPLGVAGLDDPCPRGANLLELRANLGRKPLILDRKAFEVSVVQQKEHVAVGVRGHELSLTVESEQERNARLVEGAKRDTGPQTVKSVMPGRVVHVLVREGDDVSPGTPLLILEAMKMENEIRCVTGGTVAKVFVAAGQTVINGDALVSIG